MMKRAMIQAMTTCTLWRFDPCRDVAYLFVAPFIKITRVEFLNERYVSNDLTGATNQKD